MASTIAPAERIQELSTIANDVASMLKSAGLAVNSLTGRSMESASSDDSDTKMTDDTPPSLEAQQQTFESHVTAYYSTLQAVTARLRRLVYALEEAGIISSETAALGGASRNTASSGNAEGRITNGGLGNLDVGWLNSRGNKVTAEKENEIIEEIKEFLQDQLDKRKTEGGD